MNRIQWIILVIGLSVLVPGFTINGQENDFSTIDQHTRNAPRGISRSVQELTEYLTESAGNDLEKVRAFYVWIAGNIKYDLQSYLSGTYGTIEPEGVLRSGNAVCQGYSNLFKKMCDLEGIPAFLISGYSKGYGYRDRDEIKEPDHAWNAVNIDGKWHLIDATWGSGYVNEKNRYVSKYNESFFLSNPETFIYTHLPEAPMWQLLDCPISLQDFKKDSTQMKSIIRGSETCYNYKDSIRQFLQVPDHEKDLYLAKKAYAFNPNNSLSLGFAYLNHSGYYYEKVQQYQQENNYDQFYEMLKKMLSDNENALKYLKQSKSPRASQAIEAAKSNIRSAKEGIEWYERTIQ